MPNGTEVQKFLLEKIDCELNLLKKIKRGDLLYSHEKFLTFRNDDGRWVEDALIGPCQPFMFLSWEPQTEKGVSVNVEVFVPKENKVLYINMFYTFIRLLRYAESDQPLR